VRNWRTLLEQNDQIAKNLDLEGKLIRRTFTDRPDLRGRSIQHVTPERAAT